VAQDIAQEPNANKKDNKIQAPGATPAPGTQGSKGLPSFDVGFEFLEENAKIFVAIAIVAVLGAIAYLGFDFLKSRQEKSAQAAYYAVEAKFEKLKEGYERAKFQKAMPNMAAKDGAPAKEATGNLEQDYGTLVSDVEKVATEHAGTAGGAQAAILASETYLSYKQADKAVAVAEAAAKNMNPDKVLGALTRVQWGNALAAKGDCNGAVGVWQQVLGSQKASYLHSDVSLRAGVCFETLGQNDKALEMYRKASAEGGDQSTTARTAKSFLRALETKSKSNQG
jgi:tetratricopeptide (TPR) repeat protein